MTTNMYIKKIVHIVAFVPFKKTYIANKIKEIFVFSFKSIPYCSHNSVCHRY